MNAKYHLKLATAIIFVILLAGCSGGPPVVVDLLDTTDSYGYLEAGKEKIAPAKQDQFLSQGQIGQLKRDMTFAVMRITNQADESDTIIPPYQISYNEFNPNDKANIRKKLSGAVRAIKTTSGWGTDIIGAVYRAGLIFERPEYKDCPKQMVVCSDLGDTENRPFKPNLNGVDVKILFFSPDLVPEKANAEKPDPVVWEERFREWGAKSVEIVDIDNSYGYDLSPN